MSDQGTSPTPPPTPPTPAPATVESARYEEFSSAKRNLPPAAPVAIALGIIAVVVATIAYSQRARPAAQGSIDGAWFSQPAGMDNPMILVEVTLRNVSDKTLYIKSISATIDTDKGAQSDDAASASDYERYLQAYPDLHGHAAPLRAEMRIAPGGMVKGAVMISPPVTQALFDARKDLTVTIQPYDQRAIVLHEKAAPK